MRRGRKPGIQKTGGRQRGTPNKATVSQGYVTPSVKR